MAASGGKVVLMFKAILYCCVVHLSSAKLFPYGVDHGDSELTYDTSQIESHRMDLFFPTPFMGNGLISEIYISSVGTISYGKLQNSKLDSLTSNVVMTPFMTDMGSGGRIFYRQTENDIQVLSLVSSVMSVQGVNFTPLLAVVVTWEDMPSPDDPSKTNTFQAILTTSADSTYVIFNYHDTMTWTSSSSSRKSYAGIFAAGDMLEKCGQPLKNSGTDQIWTVAETSTKSSVRGQHILDVTSPMECFSFESPCGETPALSRANAIPKFENSDDNILGWNFYVELACKAGLSVSPGVSTQQVQCLYEPDYYEYAWDFEIKECVDLSATKKFQVMLHDIVIDMVNTNDVEVIKSKLIPEINKLLRNAGITDVVVEIDELTQTVEVKSEFKDGEDSGLLSDQAVDSGTWNLKFTIFSPTYANKELTSEGLQTQLLALLSGESEILKSTTIAVQDLTDKCLQDCICFIREKSGKNCKRGHLPIPLRPDACCGGCNGKAYASSKKVCCGGRHLYDPSRAVCCPNGRIRQGTVCS